MRKFPFFVTLDIIQQCARPSLNPVTTRRGYYISDKRVVQGGTQARFTGEKNNESRGRDKTWGSPWGRP